MYIYNTKVRLHDTDAAGRLFFANQFKFFHDAYEAMMTERGLSFSEIFRTQNFSLPIVHAQADYKAPLAVGDELEIRVSLLNLGQTSLTFNYEIFRGEQSHLVGSGQTVHVAVDKKTAKKIPLPPALKERLADHPG